MYAAVILKKTSQSSPLITLCTFVVRPHGGIYLGAAEPQKVRVVRCES